MFNHHYNSLSGIIFGCYLIILRSMSWFYSQKQILIVLLHAK